MFPSSIPSLHSASGFSRAMAVIVASLAAMSAVGAPAAAQAPVTFEYTSTGTGNCRIVSRGKGEDDSATRLCGGKGGLSVLISEGDLRETVSVGTSRAAASREPAAQAWFGPFNSSGPTIEWRLAGNRPFAIIQRWQIADNDAPDRTGRPTDRSMLVVTRLPPGPVCHVAYVDAKANPDANELARQAADQSARDFRCGKDEVKIIGQRGRAVELATGR